MNYEYQVLDSQFYLSIVFLAYINLYIQFKGRIFDGIFKPENIHGYLSNTLCVTLSSQLLKVFLAGQGYVS